MKCALLAALVCTMALMSCTDDDPVVGSSPTAEEQDVDIGFTPMVISDEEQAMIDEKLALITEYYADKEPDHFLILVGNKETLVDDMSCNSHDQAVVERMLSGGNPRYLHLAPKEAIAEGALNQKYADAPDNIKEAIDYVNQFTSNVGALSDDVETGQIAFNFTNEELGIVQGNCQDLGVHHLGLFKDTEVVTAMNSVSTFASALRRLTTEHLNTDRSGLELEAEWTKNRKPCFQPLPKDLAYRLREFAQSGEPAELYAKYHTRKHHTATVPIHPLLYVPSHTARSVDQDLISAGIPKQALGGKIDFHAIRKAYINLVIESGVTVKEAQALARHASPELTMNVYGQAQDDRLAEAVERVAEVVIPVKRVPVEYQQVVGSELKSATPLETESCALQFWWRRRELNPRPKMSLPRFTTCVVGCLISPATVPTNKISSRPVRKFRRIPLDMRIQLACYRCHSGQRRRLH